MSKKSLILIVFLYSLLYLLVNFALLAIFASLTHYGHVIIKTFPMKVLSFIILIINLPESVLPIHQSYMIFINSLLWGFILTLIYNKHKLRKIEKKSSI